MTINKIYLKEVGSRIRKARKIKGISQEELASHLDLSRESLAKFETGNRIIRLDRLKSIADILSVPITYFLDDDFSKNMYAFSQVLKTLNPKLRQNLLQITFHHFMAQQLGNNITNNLQNQIDFSSFSAKDLELPEAIDEEIFNLLILEFGFEL